MKEESRDKGPKTAHRMQKGKAEIKKKADETITLKREVFSC